MRGRGGMGRGRRVRRRRVRRRRGKGGKRERRDRRERRIRGRGGIRGRREIKESSNIRDGESFKDKNHIGRVTSPSRAHNISKLRAPGRFVRRGFTSFRDNKQRDIRRRIFDRFHSRDAPFISIKVRAQKRRGRGERGGEGEERG